MTDLERDNFGRVVREAWIAWARTQPAPKPSWLVPYDDLSEADKEADRQIAEAVLAELNRLRIVLAEQMSRGELGEAEAAKFASLQGGVFAAIDILHPLPPSIAPQLEAIEKRLEHRHD